MDFSTATGATLREVDGSQRDGKPTRIVRAARAYSTSGDDLWGALTEPGRLSRWLGDVSGSFEPGGRNEIKHYSSGKITACEPSAMFAMTWDSASIVSWVRVTVKEQEQGSRMTLQHEMPTDPGSETHWAKYGPAATGVGWKMALISLDLYLAGEGGSVTDAVAAWAESEQGKARFREWAGAWADAHIISGAAADLAGEMAQATAAFYTGEC